MKTYAVLLALVVAFVCIAESTGYPVEDLEDDELTELEAEALLEDLLEDLELEDLDYNEEARSWASMAKKLKEYMEKLKQRAG
uniref:M-zodatoxin-Lt3b n=1 Tax=Lachesana tarabaevi TaxID=379576 RepID=LAT3B_LACTA|nr:RecName: Full=M-zodatoxin-Lt3b; Short=M-ZDTX-Lt3b; AltName: Full=Latarcin-3b; Short=Ltc-3b; Flags: Precursor [Lachesana tarabaevi]CAJ81657.1 latarcin 3b precursor, pLtc 3b [Lachesana tarabaevi]